ncbi:hypothetical protein HYH02_004231 [Chlamydomonas schloesseri]|uniref:O-fucosyltransferase family protein n=1 Tax=Chlamydomonas schloesseri TaxID=2026947 RepID=A0A835WNB5_9CHLO|nr:hypothetical protein HYH02_004231 [Chlamydomonas schloesseri]|eukprot:KAG2450959.1 hypothetical protein HYH02_004231 [Chlamydomonas schloesseri]
MAGKHGLFYAVFILCLNLSPYVSAVKVYRSFLYRGASTCYRFDSAHHKNATKCPDSATPGAYLGSSDEERPKDGKQLYNSALAQRFIFRHQNPADCRAARFLVAEFDEEGHGIGSTIHMMSFGLTRALTLGRVFVHAGGGAIWTRDNRLCAVTGWRWDQCIFLPFSQCTLEEVMAGTGTGAGEEEAPYLDQVDPSRWHEYRVLRTKHLSGDPVPARDFPPLLARLIARGPFPMPPGAGREAAPAAAAACAAADAADRRHLGDPLWAVQWWRAQSTAYLVRFQPHFRAAVREQRKRVFPPEIDVLPPGTIGVHVRRGDKSRESPDVDDAGYLRQVEALYAAAGRGRGGQGGGGGLTRTIFLSTEDSATAEFFQGLTNWTVLLTHVERYHEEVSPMEFAAARDLGTVVLNDFVNLDLALQCDAWVGLLSSNWVRLIHELRSVYRCKADNLFYDSRFGHMWGEQTFIDDPALFR